MRLSLCDVIFVYKEFGSMKIIYLFMYLFKR